MSDVCATDLSSGVGYGPPTVVSIPSGGGSFTLPTTDTYLIEVSSYAQGSYLLTLGGPSTPYTRSEDGRGGDPRAGARTTSSEMSGARAVEDEAITIVSRSSRLTS